MFFAVLTAAFAAVVACGSGRLETLDPSHELDASSGVIVPIDAGASPQGNAGTGLVTGLPCDVQTLLENRCIGCHDGNTTGAPRLLDYSDLVAASKSDAAKTMAQVALERMQSTASPMPPLPADPPTADEITGMQDWVSAGLSRAGACTDAQLDGGADGSPDAGVDAADAAPVCTSGVLWTNNNTGSSLMHPGVACLDCHSKMGGPGFQFAGTVYPTFHEPDDCNGKAPPPNLTVIITDKLGQKVMGTVNGAGNFSIDAPRGGNRPRLTSPFRASVTDGTTTRSMLGNLSSGDCNSCHTALGKNSAPGRIVMPIAP